MLTVSTVGGTAGAGRAAVAGPQRASSGRLPPRPTPLPPGSPREGGLEPEECVPAPKADVSVAARPALKSRGSARGARADLGRRRAGQGRDCHCAPSIPGTSQVDEPGPTEAGGATSALRPFRSPRGASRPRGGAFVPEHKARFQKQQR